MSDGSDDSGSALIEQPGIALFAELDWEMADCFYETYGPNGGPGRGASPKVDVEDLDRDMARQSP